MGLHHGGLENLPCLNQKPGKYQANEGAAIAAIQQAISKHRMS
jgi:hypothetical protein